ncbi:MAG: hypothetical protein AB8G22_11280, partial [Saprospiraceae bacterium]
MIEKNTEDSGFGNYELPEWDSLQNVTFSKVFSTSSIFFVLEKTRRYFPFWTVSTTLAMIILSIGGIAIALHQPTPPPNLIDFSNRTAILAKFDSLRCLRQEQSYLLHDSALIHTPIAEKILGDTGIFASSKVGYLYSAELADIPYVESNLLQWDMVNNSFYADSIADAATDEEAIDTEKLT